MKTSEHIEKLQKLIEKHGDLEWWDMIRKVRSEHNRRMNDLITDPDGDTVRTPPEVAEVVRNNLRTDR